MRTMGNERELVAIKVRIGLKPNGHAEYPNFNELGSVRKENMDWAIYVDQFGIGWQYDKTSGHKEHSEDSPAGMQWGMLLVPTDFAREAVEMFPERSNSKISMIIRHMDMNRTRSLMRGS
jgi:hypothetical protein